MFTLWSILTLHLKVIHGICKLIISIKRLLDTQTYMLSHTWRYIYKYTFFIGLFKKKLKSHTFICIVYPFMFMGVGKWVHVNTGCWEMGRTGTWLVGYTSVCVLEGGVYGGEKEKMMCEFGMFLNDPALILGAEHQPSIGPLAQILQHFSCLPVPWCIKCSPDH